MDENNRNFVLALVLSMLVLAGWQYFYVRPQMEAAERQQAQQQPPSQQPGQQPGLSPAVPQNGSAPQPSALPQPGQAAQPGTPAAPELQLVMPRQVAIAKTPRVAIETPSLQGSISLKGGRIDDLVLRKFKETVKPDSPLVSLLSPSGSPEPYFVESGWHVAQGDNTKRPDQDTMWKQEGNNPLTPATPVTLVYDNGAKVIFRRTISVDTDYMFTIKQEVENKSDKPVTVYPYSLISRQNEPVTAGFYILHEGLIGVMEDRLKEFKYADIKSKQEAFKTKGGWLGFTDKYWATALIPDQQAPVETFFWHSNSEAPKGFQTFLRLSPVTVAPGTRQATSMMLFAGAKQSAIIDAYADQYKITMFDKMIDWGWFPFITKPLFLALHFFYKLVGNFGLAILIVTVIVKGVFFPLQNKSYASMTKMKKLQPEIKRLQERFADDKMKQQQAMMELYKKEKVNPMAGCLPILIQIPVFFALYKVIYVSIEMRHAPFFGWIQDLSAPDPTSIFNLFGLIPWSPPAALMIGIWPLIMGATMWVQMKLNPAAPDPMQQRIFDWMPVFFTYLLCAFPAGLVIYWTWNNLLSIAQQWVIMRKQGVEVNLLENMGFGKKNAAARKGSLAE